MRNHDSEPRSHFTVTHLAEKPSISAWALTDFWKRCFDVAVSSLLLVLFAPLLLAISFAVLVTSPGKVIFKQPRIGKAGRPFSFYKFRSMCVDAETVLGAVLAADPVRAEEWRKYQKLKDDPRVTSIGRFLRKTSLDELPQLWNVLKGDMSLVGPRPCMVEQRDLYGVRWSIYTSVRPGITGLWQVSGRSALSYERRVELDVEYVATRSFFRDVNILYRTIWVVVRADDSH